MSSLRSVLACSQAVGLLKVQAAAQKEQPKEKMPADILTERPVLVFHHLLQAYRCLLILVCFHRIKKIFVFPPMSCAQEY